MSRSARLKSSSGIYHVMIRGNEKKNIFADDRDRERFIKILERKNPKNEWRIYAFCLMDNHVHLIIDEMNEDLSQIMKIINTTYVYYYNHKYKRVGHLFQDRYKSEPIETDAYLLAAIRYIHRNPLQAGLVKDLQTYKWSSYNSYLDKTDYSRIINTSRILEMFSENSLITAKRLFIEFSEQETDEVFLDCPDDIDLDSGIGFEYIDTYLSEKALTLKDLNFKDNRDIRDDLIKNLSQRSNLSVRELANILNLSKSTVHKISKKE